MCGIAGGIWTQPERAITAPVLDRMIAVLRQRGPDDAGHYRRELSTVATPWVQPGVALGHRRLAILDLATGQQPLSNEDDSVWIVFNGEIYNFPALRRRLEGAGHRFRTQSDTETILHLYEDEGLDCFNHLNGMFALALWDARRRRLVLARDRLGKKPLVYRHEPGRVLFASELKSLLQVPDVPRNIDLAAVDAYLLYQYVPHPRTIYQGVSKLPPGHYAVFEEDRYEIHPYWQPDWNREQAISELEAMEQLRDLLTSAVKLRLQSEVPLGAFLSGGVDSSLVAALAQKELSRPLKTFTIGFASPQYDERPFAQQVAVHLGCEHHAEEIQPQAVKLLPEIVAQFDEPFADSSAIPTWCLAQLTRQHVTVALSGDGGDELFLGYERYRAVGWSAALEQWPSLRTALGSPLWQTLPSSGAQRSLVRRLQRFSASLRQPAVERYADWISIFDEQRRGEIYAPEFVTHLSAADPLGFLRAAWGKAKRRDAMTTAAIADLLTYLPCDLLTKVDQCSMAHSLEARQPFLDYRVVEFVASLPRALKYRWGRGKRLLRLAFGDLLPNTIWRRHKMGFGVPLDAWFRRELRPQLEELTSDSSPLLQTGWFHPPAIRALIDEHWQQRFNHAARLWSLVVLNQWLSRR